MNTEEKAVQFDTVWDPDDLMKHPVRIDHSNIHKFIGIVDNGIVSNTQLKFAPNLGVIDIQSIKCRGLQVGKGTYLDVKGNIESNDDIKIDEDVVVRGDILTLTRRDDDTGTSYIIVFPSLKGKNIRCLGDIYTSGSTKTDGNLQVNEIVVGGTINVGGKLSATNVVVKNRREYSDVEPPRIALSANESDVKSKIIVGEGRIDIKQSTKIDSESQDVLIDEEPYNAPRKQSRFVVRSGNRDRKQHTKSIRRLVETEVISPRG
jgi:cytoskeletal protein CcmA (bactofilin family)